MQSLKLQADMAVLSACQTGLGGEHDAGVIGIGIGRAFFLPGVPHVITSLWSVDDDATADLMTRFVRQIQLSNTTRYFPADSLRLAMLQARREGKQVGHWASFVHFGGGECGYPMILRVLCKKSPSIKLLRAYLKHRGALSIGKKHLTKITCDYNVQKPPTYLDHP